jgi:isopentenyl-diphosphate delta-isomerase
MKHVVLCDEHGNSSGTMEIVAAHQGEGTLHRAFSVFVFRNGGSELLLQQRSAAKPLFPLLWANTCCSHPQQDEGIAESAEKRLQEEMGFTCPLKEIASFVYQARDPSGKGAEHEYDTVLMGMAPDDVAIEPDPAEVADWRWVNLEELQIELDETPELFAPWFPEAVSLIFR